MTSLALVPNGRTIFQHKVPPSAGSYRKMVSVAEMSIKRLVSPSSGAGERHCQALASAGSAASIH